MGKRAEAGLWNANLLSMVSDHITDVSSICISLRKLTVLTRMPTILKSLIVQKQRLIKYINRLLLKKRLLQDRSRTRASEFFLHGSCDGRRQ